MDAPGQSVAGLQNDIVFSANAPVAAAANHPDCSVNPAINKGFTSFAFQPPGCTPQVSCTGMRAVVISLSNTNPIPDGSVLYTCNVAISPSAADGVLSRQIGRASWRERV